MTTMEFHEAANIFPLDAEHLQELADDIAKNGLWTPIELYHGLILDGRRRYKACQLAKVEPDYMEVNPPDPVAYVLSLNLHRRHLKPSQLAMIGARAKDYYAAEAKERQREHGGTAPGKKRTVVEKSTQVIQPKSRDAAGEAVGVSGYSIDRATEVLASGKPEVVEAVDTGKVSVNAASKIAQLPQEQQAEALQEKLEHPRRPPEKPARTETEKKDRDHRLTELFARNVADVAIAQLEGIPKRNKHRDEAFVRVEKWIEKQRNA